MVATGTTKLRAGLLSTSCFVTVTRAFLHPGFEKVIFHHVLTTISLLTVRRKK